MNSNNVYSTRYNLIVGGMSLTVLLVLSILFFRERIGLSDTAFYFFTMLKTDSPAIFHKRFIAVFTQLFPLLGAKMNLSFGPLAMLYSASFVILQAITFFVINNVLKNPRMALGYLLFLTLMTAHTFFWTQSELPQGVGLLFIYFALFEKMIAKQKASIPLIIISILLLITVAFSHPLLLFAFLFFHAFMFSRNRRTNTFIIGATFVFVLIILIKMFAFSSKYDSVAFEGLNNFKYLFPNYITIQANKNFVRYLFSDYYFLLILAVTNSIYYLRKKEFYKLFISASFVIGFTTLVNVCYHGGGNQFYYENQYLILGVFVIIPFLFDVVPKLIAERKYLFYAIPVIISLVCFLRIDKTQNYYRAMVDWKLQTIENLADMKDKRVLFSVDQIPKTAILDTWSNAYEFWFLSTLEFDYSQATIIEDEPEQYDHTAGYTEEFITPFEWTKYSELKPPYFKYAPSTKLERYRP